MSSLQDSIRKVSKPPNYIYEIVTPSDSINLKPTVSVVGINGSGAAGDIAVEQLDGSTFVFENMQPGAFAYINIIKILATGTTATGLIVGRLY